MPVSGPGTERYGGHTTSFTLAGDDIPTILFDCGTGLARIGDAFDTDTFHVFITHYHLDHLQGLQFFEPLYESGVRFVFHGFSPDGLSVQQAIEGMSQEPWFPVPLMETPSSKEFVAFDDGRCALGPVTISSATLHHPQGVNGYRIDYGATSLVLATDHEAGDAAADARLLELADGVDVLVHDAQYRPDELPFHLGWGHSTWEDAVEMARRSSAASLVLTSHDPAHSDEDIDRIVASAAERFPGVVAAYEGLEIPLGPP